MLSPECSQFSLGAPLVSAKAFFELRDLFASLNLRGDFDRASLHANPEEGVDEAINKAALPTDEPTARQYLGNGESGRPGQGPHRRSDGTTRQRRSRRRKRTARKRRGG